MNYREQVKQFLEEKNDLTEGLKVWVKDKSVPLEERWDVFLDSELGEISTYYEDYDGVDTDDLLADHDKYQVIRVEHILERIEDDEDAIRFKEDVLDKFSAGFEYDW